MHKFSLFFLVRLLLSCSREEYSLPVEPRDFFVNLDTTERKLLGKWWLKKATDSTFADYPYEHVWVDVYTGYTATTIEFRRKLFDPYNVGEDKLGFEKCYFWSPPGLEVGLMPVKTISWEHDSVTKKLVVGVDTLQIRRLTDS